MEKQNSQNPIAETALVLGKGSRLGIRTLTLLLGAGIGVLLFTACDHNQAAKPTSSDGLTDASKSVLSQLSVPVEIRFYSVLDSNTVPESTFAFAQRVEKLLASYEEAAGGKVKAVREQGDAEKASSEGLGGFNREKGDVCYLGIVIAGNTRRETLPRLDPQWEQALEADVSRAIARVGAPLPSPAKTVASTPDPAVQEAVKRQLPDLASVSVEEGTKRLRQAAFEEFRKAVTEMEPGLKAAQEKIRTAQGPEQEAARQELRRLQADQTDRLKEIAARSQAQIDALRQMKGAQ